MNSLKFTLHPLSAFATPLAGDTLFGQLCWAVRERFGEGRLRELLDGYVDGRPFLVVSDGFPSGLLPRPTAPDFVLGLAVVDPARRKLVRSHRWLPAGGAGQPITRWMDTLTASDAVRPLVLTQNTINRYTGTTGEDQFAPRQVDRSFFCAKARVDVYTVIDERISADALHQLFTDVGNHGYGRDATTGLGKFEVEQPVEASRAQRASHHWLTLAPCQPDPDQLVADGCFYKPLTRFGRHGNIAALTAQPFKRPLLLIATGALLRSREPAHWVFHGCGLGGSANRVSDVIPDTVHQGYAPVLPLIWGPSSESLC
jgi:CRISPR-associated protein Csm4